MPFVLSSAGLLGILFFILLERRIPFRKPALLLWQRWLINFSMSLCNLLVVDQCFVILLQQKVNK